MRYSYRSKKGFIPNTQKFNQDAYIVSPNLSKKSYQHYFGICDGHGTNGHHVSTFIKTQLTHLLTTHPNIPSNPSDNLYKAFKCTVDKLLN
jgi:serine/threonine protein phosphatase PrpC